jgi:hypothetical protein
VGIIGQPVLDVAGIAVLPSASTVGRFCNTYPCPMNPADTIGVTCTGSSVGIKHNPPFFLSIPDNYRIRGTIEDGIAKEGFCRNLGCLTGLTLCECDKGANDDNNEKYFLAETACFYLVVHRFLF